MYREDEVVPVAINQYGFLTSSTKPKALVTAGRNSLILGIRDKEAGIGVLANLNRPDLNDSISANFRDQLAERFLAMNAAVLSMDIYNHEVTNEPSGTYSRRQFVENLRFFLEERGLVVIPTHNHSMLVACFFDLQFGVLPITQSERIGFMNRKLMRSPKNAYHPSTLNHQAEDGFPITEIKVS